MTQRPRKSLELTETLKFRVSPKELDAIEACANFEGLDVSTYCRIKLRHAARDTILENAGKKPIF